MVIGILVALLIIVALVVGAFLILNYDGEKKMTNTTATTDYQETIEYKGHTYVYNENVVTMAFLGVDKRELGKAENHTSTMVWRIRILWLPLTRSAAKPQ